jgi:hypothetical protein
VLLPPEVHLDEDLVRRDAQNVPLPEDVNEEFLA